MTSPIVLALGGGLAFSLSHFLVRLGLGASNPTTAVTVNVTVNALGLWVLAALFSPIRPLASVAAWPFVLAGLFAPSLARILLYHGYKHMGLARSSVLAGTVSVFSVSMAILFLGERPSAVRLLGILCIVVGVGALSFSRTSGVEWARWAILLPLGAALCFSLRDVFSKVGLGMIPVPITGASIAATTAALVLYLSFFVSKGREKIILTSESFWLFFGSGILLVAAYYCVYAALKSERVSLISPLVSLHPIYSVILSYLFLQKAERVTRMVIAGGVLVVAGAAGVLLG
ncbi:MAG: DMT family transporter [bacterium]